MASSNLNTSFQVKAQSPSAHLQILRDPKKYNSYGSSYFSPALGNCSDTWIRHRAQQLLNKRIEERKLSNKLQLAIKTDRIFLEDISKREKQIRDRRNEIARMATGNVRWVIDSIVAQKKIEAMEKDLAQAKEQKIDITEDLEKLMQLEGRSLEEMKGLKEAANGSKYWPVGFDSDAESTAEESDEEDDDEEDHLYSFPLPKPTNTNSSSSTVDSNLDEDSIAKLLKPDAFNWADEEDDHEPTLDCALVQPETAEDLFEYMVNDAYDALYHDLEVERVDFREQQKKPFTELVEAYNMGARYTANQCSWLVHPLGISKEEYNAPLDGIPNIILTTPEGEVCELEERVWSLEGPGWEQYCGERAVGAAESRKQLKLWETFDDRIARLEAEAYWERIKQVDNERAERDWQMEQAWAQHFEEERSLGHYQELGHSQHSSFTPLETIHEVDSETEDLDSGIVVEDAESNKENSTPAQLSISPIFVWVDQLPVDESTYEIPSDRDEGKTIECSQQTGLSNEDRQPIELIQHSSPQNHREEDDGDDVNEDLFDDTQVATSGSSTYEGSDESSIFNNTPEKTPRPSICEISDAITVYNDFKRLLATKVQDLTSACRRIEVEDAHEAMIAQDQAFFDTRDERYSMYEAKLRYSLVSLDLRARLEDNLILRNTAKSICYTNDETENNKSQGPSEIQFVGPILNTIFQDSWIIDEAPLYVQHNGNYWLDKCKNLYTQVRLKLRDVDLKEIHYRSNTAKYKQLREYMKEEIDEEIDDKNTKLNFIIEDGIWEAEFDNDVRVTEQHSLVSAENLEDTRDEAYMDWILERQRTGKFNDIDSGCREAGGYRPALRLEASGESKSVDSALKEEGGYKPTRRLGALIEWKWMKLFLEGEGFVGVKVGGLGGNGQP